MGVVTRFSKITPAKKWEPLVPLEVLTDGLKYKQQLFDKNADLVNQQLTQGSQLASQIDNLAIRDSYQKDFNNLVSDINGSFATADISKQDVFASLNEQGKNIAQNKMYAEGIAMSRHFRDQDKLITESKTKDGGKYYNSSAEYVVGKRQEQFKNASINDYNKIPLVEYSPYYDTTEQEMKLIDKIKPTVEAELTNLGVDKSSNIYMQRVEELTKDRVKSAMLNFYQNDPKALRQFQFDYEYNMDVNPTVSMSNIDEHANQQFGELNKTISSLKEARSNIKDNQLKTTYDQTIAAYELQKQNLDKKYTEAKQTGDVSKYFTLNDFMSNRADDAANTYSYKKVVSLAADQYSLAQRTHDFKLQEIQIKHGLDIERDRLKAYADATASTQDVTQTFNDNVQFEGSKLFNNVLTAKNKTIKISNGDVAALTGEPNANNDGNYGLIAEYNGVKFKTSTFMGEQLQYDPSTNKYYMTGIASSSDPGLKGKQGVTAVTTITAGIPTVSYKIKNLKIEVNPTTAMLTRNKQAYGSSKAFNLAQSQSEVYNASRESANRLSSSYLTGSGTTLSTTLSDPNSNINKEIAKIKDINERKLAKSYVQKLLISTQEQVNLGINDIDAYHLSTLNPMEIGQLEYILQNSKKIN